MAYALAGHVADEDFSFDARTEFRRQASELRFQGFDSEVEYLNALCRPVAEAMNDARHLAAPKILDVIFGGSFDSSIFLASASFRLLNGRARFDVRSTIGVNYSFCYGSAVIYAEMYDERGLPRPDSRLSRYTVDLGARPRMNDAKAYAVGYIEACCSPEGRELDPQGTLSIGGHIHVATVKPKAGFQWLIPPKGVTDA